MSYEDDIKIDETALDVEWVIHADKVRDRCRAAADAKREVELAEHRVDVEAARLNREVRLDPAAYGVVPGARGVTEDAIKAAITLDEGYQELQRAVIEARHAHDLARGEVTSFDHRKSALENLVRLHGANWFAGPATPRDLTEMRRERDRRVQSSVRIRRRN